MGEIPSLMGSLVYMGGAGFSEKSLGKCSPICLPSVGNRMRLKRNGKGRSGYLHSTVFLYTLPGEIAINTHGNSMYLGQEKTGKH